MINCPHTTAYEIFVAQVSYEMLAYVKKGQYVQKGVRQDEAGREKQAFLQYLHENELQYIAFFVLLLQFEREFSDAPWTDYISPSEWDCIIANFRCDGIDIRPFLNQSCINISDPDYSCETCTGEGIGNTEIEDFLCPFFVYPDTEPTPNPLCAGDGIGNEIIEDPDCGFTVYPT